MMIVNLINSTISKLLIYKTYNHSSTPELCTTFSVPRCYLTIYCCTSPHGSIVIYQYQCIATTTSLAYKNTNINRATSLITLFNSNHAISLWLQSIATCNSELIYINVSTVNRNVYIQLTLFSSVYISAYSQHASSVLSVSIMKVSICLCYGIPQQHILYSIYEK